MIPPPLKTGNTGWMDLRRSFRNDLGPSALNIRERELLLLLLL